MRWLGRRSAKAGIQAALAAAVCLAVNLAHADEQDTVYATAGAAITYDDNLFRLPSGTNLAPLGLTGKGTDRVVSANVGLNFHKEYSLQDIRFNVTEAVNRFDTYSYLDNSDLNYSLTWGYKITPHFTGTLTASQTQIASTYGDYRNYKATDVITNAGRNLQGDWWVAGPWHVLAHLSEFRLSNSAQFTQLASYLQYGEDAGVEYRTTSDNWTHVLLKTSHGGYDNSTVDPITFTDSTFVQYDVEWDWHWAFTGKSSFDGTLDETDRRYTHFSIRDYRGLAGNVTYNWSVTPNILLKLSGLSQIAPYQDLVAPYYTSSYLIDHELLISPVWTIGEREQLTLKYQAGRRNFDGPIFSINPVPRRDLPVLLSAEFDWTPGRTGVVSAVMQHNSRGSTVPGFAFVDNTFTLSTQWTF